MEIHFENWSISITQHSKIAQFDNDCHTIFLTGDIPTGYSWDLLVQSVSTGQMNIISLVQHENSLSVTLSANDLAKDGCYNIQLRGTSTDTSAIRRHTNIVTFLVDSSLSGDLTWPTLPTEFSQCEARIQSISLHPPIPNESGFWQVWNVDSQAYQSTELPVALECTQGPQGPAGATGAAGKSAYASAQDGGYTGTETQFNSDLADVSEKYSASNPPPYPVTSINSRTGAVTVAEVPSGGTTDQVLTKTTNGYGWADPRDEGAVRYDQAQTLSDTQKAQARNNIAAVEALMTDVTYYVSPSGSDNNDGSQAHPFKTIQHGIDILPKNLNGKQANINLAPQTYSENISIIGFYGAGNLVISGAEERSSANAASIISTSRAVSILNCFCTVRLDYFAELSGEAYGVFIKGGSPVVVIEGRWISDDDVSVRTKIHTAGVDGCIWIEGGILKTHDTTYHEHIVFDGSGSQNNANYAIINQGATVSIPGYAIFQNFRTACFRAYGGIISALNPDRITKPASLPYAVYGGGVVGVGQNINPS